MQNSKLQSKIQNYFVGMLVAFLLTVSATPVFAAELFFEAETQNVAIGQELWVNLFLNTENEELNAVEGNVVFPNELVEFKEIRDGNSIINFWIERPKVERKGTIVFSGIIPGGYKETKGLLFSLVFESKNKGTGTIEISEIRALRNDGVGIPADVKVSSTAFSIVEKPQVASQEPLKIKDNDLPERFRPEIAHDPTLFNGKWFLVFATQDKGSGIDHYEVREGFRSGFVTAESPYFLLQNQNLDEKIFVKITDKAGNERTEILYPPNFHPWYKNYWIFGILVITGAILVAYIVRKLWRKYLK